MPFRLFFVLLLLVAAVRAQAPSATPTPLVTSDVNAGATSTSLLKLEQARRALELGMPSMAAELYEQLLAAPDFTGPMRNSAVLQLVTARLDEGNIPAAEQAFAGYVGLPTAASRLRGALVDVGARRFDAARAALPAIKLDELPVSDRSWLHYLQGVLASEARDANKAQEAFGQALSSATSSLQRARFTLAVQQARLTLGQVNEASANSQRDAMLKSPGSPTGYAFTSLYAVSLNALGRKGEAITLLREQLQALPPAQRGVNDEFRFILGLIAGPDNDTGKNALYSILNDALDPDKQRVALQLLSGVSRAGGERTRFRRTLSTLIAAPRAHPILEDLLLFRAQLGLTDPAEEKNAGGYAQIEADVNSLLEKFPGSQLRPAALGVLVSMSWERLRYRTAATYAVQARDALRARETSAAGQSIANLGVLVAEAYFRAGDFRNAADAYGSALAEVPAGVTPGALMFQRVIAEIEAGKLDMAKPETERLRAAQELLDQLAGDPRLDLINRWRAEWNLTRSLQAAGQTAAALSRVNRLREQPVAGGDLPPDLRVRIAWLQAWLSFEAGDAGKALVLADGAMANLDGTAPELKAEITSTLLLLKARAQFSLDHDQEALALLAGLRTQYPRADAAVYSYIIEADYYVAKNQLVDAQTQLRVLADQFKDHVYAPYALYQTALVSEQRGEDQYYKDAYRTLEQLVQEYPKSDLFFYARLKQGDLERRLNDFGVAEQIYAELVTKYPDHPDALVAQLALAACHRALSTTDPSRFESALAIFDRLLFHPAASADLRLEAGFQYGDMLMQRGNLERAYAVWWPLVNTYVLDPKQAEALGASGRNWAARIVTRVGEILDQQGKPGEARNAYQLIIDKGLPGAAYARSRLERGRVASESR